jgi:DNA-binding LytR/AlgR family response regulator
MQRIGLQSPLKRDTMRSMNTNRTNRIAVEELQGAEMTPFGEVAYIIAETDGVDVVFTDGECHHFNYGESVEVIR